MAIPSRFDLSMTPAGRFLQLQQPQTPRPQSQVIARDALGRISAAGAPLPSAGPQATPRTPFGFRKDVMDRLTGIQPTMGAVPPPPPPKKPMSFMDRISPEFGTPASAGLGAAAATGLQMSGYSPTPISTAQGLGAMMQSGMQAFQAAKAAETAEKRVALQDKIAMAKLGKKSDFEEKLALAGIDASTPEGQSFIREMLTKSDTEVNLGGKESEFNKESVKYAFRFIGEADKSINQVRDFEPRLEQIMKLLSAKNEDGSPKIDTGRLNNITFPFRQIMADAGLLSDEDAANLSSEELVRQSIAFIIPRMRVAGSGSTSDKEMVMFANAAPNFNNSTEGNRKIAAGMAMIIKHQKERRNLMDDYMSDKSLGDGTLNGFNRWADEKQGDIFPTYDTPELMTDAYESGKVKVGDLIFNGKDFIVINKKHLGL